MATLAVSSATLGVTRALPVRRMVIGWVLVIPLLFFAVNGHFSFQGVANSTSDGDSLSGLASTGHNLGFFGYAVFPGIAYSILLWQILKNAGRVISLASQMNVITLLALLTICSAFWSQEPIRSAYNGVFYLIETLFAFYLVLKFDHREIMSMAMMAGGLLAILGLVMVIVAPQFAVLHSARDPNAWQGAFGDRSGAAKCLVFLLSPALTLRRRSFRYYHILYIALLCLMIFMAHAMTARVVLLGYVTFLILLRVFNTFGRRSAPLICGVLLTIAVVTGYFALAFLPQILHSMGRSSNLSGRTGIWASVGLSIAKRPVLGYGFYAFWLGLKGESADLIVRSNWVFGYAHNGILEIWLQLGALGVVVFLVTLITAIRNAWFCLRNGCPPGVEWYMGIIALTIMYNIDESTVLWPNDLLSILYIVGCCGLAMAARQIKSRRATEALYI